ncbi:MAG: hypothetical protein ACYTXC_29325 [Nostoc sp.]
MVILKSKINSAESINSDVLIKLEHWLYQNVNQINQCAIALLTNQYSSQLRTLST